MHRCCVATPPPHRRRPTLGGPSYVIYIQISKYKYKYKYIHIYLHRCCVVTPPPHRRRPTRGGPSLRASAPWKTFPWPGAPACVQPCPPLTETQTNVV